MTLAFDLLTLKVVSESRVKWAISVPILVFLGLSVLELRPMYVTDVRRQTKAWLVMPPPISDGGITSEAHPPLFVAISVLAGQVSSSSSVADLDTGS